MQELAFLQKQDFIQYIANQGGQAYLVGGSVRDLLLNKQPKDFDIIITNIKMQDLITHLKKFGFVNQVGKSFGIIKFKPKNSDTLEFDLSLPRKEQSTGIGHRDFTVEFSHEIPVEQDLGRRDFTINAMAFNINTQELIDPFNGQADLKNKILKQVFTNSFIEDPLRMLRAIQFSSRFHLTIEEQTLQALKKHAELIKTISKERIIQEIAKLFLSQKPSTGFDLMHQVGLLDFVFPFVSKMMGVKQPKKQNEDVYQHTMKVLNASRNATELLKPGDINLMFAALMHDAGKPKTAKYYPEKNHVTFYGHQFVSKKIAKKWLNEHKARTVGVDIGKVLRLIENHMFETKAHYSERAIRRFVNKLGKEEIFDLIDLRIADKKGGRFPDSMKGILILRDKIQAEIDKEPPFSAKDLAITGHDLMQWGYTEGRLLGNIIRFLVDKVLDDPQLNTVESLKELALNKFKLTS